MTDSGLLAVRPRITDSTLRLCALSRLCIARYRRSFMDGGLQDASSQAACTRQRDALFRVMVQKIQTGNLPLAERCFLLDGLHTLMGETGYVVNPRKQEQWDLLADEVLGEFFSQPEPVAPATVAAACRCLLDLFYFSAPDDSDAWWVFLKDTVSAWAAAFTDRNGWGIAVTLTDALARLEVMNRYSYMYLDCTHDNLLRRAYDFYVLVCGSSGSWLPGIPEQLYSLALEGNAWPVDYDLASRALQALVDTPAPTDIDRNLYIHAWQADWQCRTEMQTDYHQESI